jgi:hypothetical protein
MMLLIMKYLVLYRSQGALNGMSVAQMFANSTPEQMAAGMAAWNTWREKAGDAVLDLGAPLDKPTAVSGGKSTPGRSSITGYSILEAASIEAAVDLVKDHPHFHTPDPSIEVLECVPMPGL